MKVEMPYYGDLSNKFFSIHTKKNWTPSREKDDKEDRTDTLAALKMYGTNQFTKHNYKKVRELSDVLKESVTDLLSGPLSIFGVGDELAGIVAPDIEHYWNPDTKFGSDVRWRLTEVLRAAINAEDKILLVGHSLGTIVSYDVLWEFSHYGEYQALRKKKHNISLVTLGSPLGDENVKQKLKGAEANGERNYPLNINKWSNFAAEDDYISHDSTLANDFKGIREFGQQPEIVDYKIHNMAGRGDNSNPHHATGYLVHPEFTKVVSDWLSS